jgi:hypothetical protein
MKPLLLTAVCTASLHTSSVLLGRTLCLIYCSCMGIKDNQNAPRGSHELSYEICVCLLRIAVLYAHNTCINNVQLMIRKDVTLGHYMEWAHVSLLNIIS